MVVLAALLGVAACGTVSTGPPVPTPADFQGIASLMVARGLRIEHIVSGDAGCDDPDLTPTAIGLDARGLDQPAAVRLRLYIFRNRASYERLRQRVDACARSFVTDPETYESFDTSPFVVAGQGPWAPDFKATLEQAVVEAAGSGD